MKIHFSFLNNRFFSWVFSHKWISGPVALFLCGAVTLSVIAIHQEKSSSSNKMLTLSSQTESLLSSELPSESSSFASSSTISFVSSESASQNVTSKPTTSKKASSSNKSTTSKKTSNSNNTIYSGYQYNTNLDIESNVFMDSLIYTGYNMKKHRADGNMWVYILAARKRGLGYLSNITYNGGSTGLERNSKRKPDIKAFERGGLVCASFATYVYFNYLPNVAGIDTSSLPRPKKTTLAYDWHQAVKLWVKKGYSYSIPFTAKLDSNGYIKFTPKQTIPIGSIIIFQENATRNGRGSHVAVYAGYKNGNHWVYHVGNKNGPEMCAVERMIFGPEPQWPLMVVATPTNIRMAAMVDITLKDNDGKPIKNVAFTLKNTKTGQKIKLGKTNTKGNLQKSGLKYGRYELTHTVPSGYTGNSKTTISLTPKNNSKNVIKVVDKKIPTSSSAPSSGTPSSGTPSSTTTSSSAPSSSPSSENSSIQ